MNDARRGIALLLLLVLQVVVLGLLHERTDLSSVTFILTYWIAIASTALLIYAIWPHDTDD